MMPFNVSSVLRDATESTGNYTFERGSCGEQLAFSSGRSCSCDVKTIDPDLTKPSYLSSPFSQVNNQTDTFLAPRTGHEQPYWYSPSYFGWQYVTKATHIAHQSSFLQLKYASSVDFQPERYLATAECEVAACHNVALHSVTCHASQYQCMGCKGFDCQTTGCQECQVSDYQIECEATGCPSTRHGCTERRVTKYLSTECKAMSECHKPGYQDMECHATDYRGNNGHATRFQASDSESGKAQRVDGLAYDHGEFPKIISVHSMPETQPIMQENAHIFNPSNDIRSNFAKTGLDMSSSFANQASKRWTSTCSENSTALNNECTKQLGPKTCVNVECHENDVLNKLTSDSLCNIRSESKIVQFSTTEHASSHHLMTTILKDDSQSSASQSACDIVPNTAFNRASDYNKENRELSAINTNNCDSLGAESLKIPFGTPRPLNFIHGSRESELKTTASTECEEKNSWTQNREQLVMLKKKTMIQNRIPKISNIQKRLISEDKKQQTLLVEKTATLEKEIKHLSNSATDIDGSENFIREESPQNTTPEPTPVKMSSLLPNKELTREARKTDAKFSHQTSEVVAMNARNSMKKSIISKQADEKLSMDGYRMNLFEKMELLNGKSRTSPPTGLASELTNSPVGELRKSRTSHTKYGSVSEGPSKGIAECNASVFSVVYSGDTQQSKDRQTWDNSSGDFSDRITGETFEHSSSDKVKFNAFYPELPNSWSSAYISESQIGNKIKASRGELKRKQGDIHALNVESLKRRCRTLPRKVVRKDVLEMNFDVTSLDNLPMSERERTEFRYNQESLSPEIGETKERDEIIVDCSDVNLLVKPGCEFNTPKVYEDESLQRNMELRDSKISDLLRKQRGLLQSLEKKATNMMKSAW